jgi:uncharacterized Fe-S radical SAM superfamily protein PflX
MSKNWFAVLFMIPFSYCCRSIGLPEKQYRLIEDIIFHWVNREYDYDLYYDVDVGMTPSEQSKRYEEVRLSIQKCEYCERMVNTENNKGHSGWCPESVNPNYGK